VAASATTETVTIGTTAASSLIDGPLGRPNRIFYALLFPAMVGLLLPITHRKRKSSAAIGLMAMLVLLMLLPGCSSSSTPHNPGTPVGQTNVTVTATSSTISHTITVNLNVQ